ncbi:MAG: FeoA family protein [Pyrinomonadaceae bacterium]
MSRITDNITSLHLLRPGLPARVSAVSSDNLFAQRLMEMGLIVGSEVEVIKGAPFGGPIEVRVRGYHLALRRNEAEAVEVVVD